MPNLNITPQAVRLTQSTTNTPTLLSNIGSANVFLGSQASVNSDVFDHFLSPGKQVTWPADKELYAVTASGDESTVTVFYDAQGASATEVGIIGPVDVDVINPVNVQGGGETLLQEVFIELAANSVTNFSVPAPASGLTYYGLQVFFTLLSGGSIDRNVSVELITDLASAIPDTRFSVENPGIDANRVGDFGFRNRVFFTVPVVGAYPFTLRVYNPSSNTVNVTFSVRGVSQAFPHATDTGQWIDTVGITTDAMVNWNNGAVGEYITIAPSYEDRVFTIDTVHNTTAGRIVVEAAEWNLTTVGATNWYETENFPNHANYGGTVITSNDLEPFTKSRFVIPGTGQPHRLIATMAITGIVRVAYRGRGMA